MSNVTAGVCANTDISGIGIRVATYAQNILSFVPAFYAILDNGTVSSSELRFIKDQSTNILLTAFGLLISTIVQAIDSQGLDNYHVALVLNLSWMNNTSTFIYLLLLVHRAIWQSDVEHRKWTCGAVRKKLSSWLTLPTLVGSLHLTLMAGVGIWLWANPGRFGTSAECLEEFTLPPSISVLGHNTFFSSSLLRIISLVIYAIVTIPGINLIAPMLFLSGPYLVLKREDSERRARWSYRCLVFALFMLLVINIIFVVDTELAISRNEFRQAGQDNVWTLGQVLALLLVVLPLRSLLEYLWSSTGLGAHFGKTKLGTAMKGFRGGPDRDTINAIEMGEGDPWGKVRNWMSTIGDTPVKPGLSWMYLAARDGQADVVHFLLGNIPDINEITHRKPPCIMRR
ncbi:hypothetical protein C8F04DRAFT_157581 [Mycena alexandri]|uniref:Uncharacterized protein n=1 Tax=Mycena alexandri TaxID=1745969 RepID=A0AAD6TCF9_9AGAR|nr:hypothetical protein C8F04DRAFT_157581 [Mycena alexandri]